MFCILGCDFVMDSYIFEVFACSGAPLMGKRGPLRGKKDFTPVPWDKYFEKFEDLKLKNGDVS